MSTDTAVGGPPRWARFADAVLAASDAAGLAAARAAFHDDEASDPIAWIAASADLEPSELEVLAVLVGDAWRDDGEGVRLAHLGALLGPDAVDALEPDGVLRRHHLVDVDDAGGPGRAVARPAPTVAWYALGHEPRDPELPATAALFPGEPAAASGRWLVHGDDRVRRWQTAAALVGTTRLLVVPEPTDERAWAAVVRTATCRQCAVVVETAALAPMAGLVMQRADTVAWVVASRRALALSELPFTDFAEVAAGDEPASEDEIRAVLGALPPTHRLQAGQVELLRRIVNLPADDAVRRLASGALDRLASRIHPRRTWSDLVLPPEKLRRVRDVVERARHHDTVYRQWGFSAVPSDGVAALFAGPPGTGKTMAAEIIAGELGLDAFRIDLSTTVSKYIGETEKQLDELFDAAEGGGVLLLFDEADALFGKRTSVGDSHDRYANIETSYLLQRLEAYTGIVVLTTNLASNIDEAFLRRLHVMVEFELPDEAERRRIWQASFPPGAPLGDDVDVDFLARQLKFSGGSIRGAVLAGAFAAATDGSPITMLHVMLGAKRELQKLGRLVTAADFGPWHDVVQRAAPSS